MPDRYSAISEWVAAGVVVEDDCPAADWIAAHWDAPATALANADPEIILAGCMGALSIGGSRDPEFFIDLVNLHSDSEAVKRWAASHG